MTEESRLAKMTTYLKDGDGEGVSKILVASQYLATVLAQQVRALNPVLLGVQPVKSLTLIIDR